MVKYQFYQAIEAIDYKFQTALGGWISVETLIVWKVSKYGVISGPYFLVFGLNTDTQCLFKCQYEIELFYIHFYIFSHKKKLFNYSRYHSIYFFRCSKVTAQIYSVYLPYK